MPVLTVSQAPTVGRRERYAVDVDRMVSKRCSIRRFEPCDLVPVMAFVMDPAKSRELFPFRAPHSSKEALQWIEDTELWLVGSGESPIAGFWIDKAEFENGCVHVFTLCRDKGLASGSYMVEACVLFTAVALDRMNVRRIYTGPHASNESACKLWELAGYRREGIMIGASVVNGVPADVALYAMLRGEI